jgi:hypothetical protein
VLLNFNLGALAGFVNSSRLKYRGACGQTRNILASVLTACLSGKILEAFGQLLKDPHRIH